MHSICVGNKIQAQQPFSSIEGGDEPLSRAARDALSRATKYTFNLTETDGHWCGELRSNATITAEYVFLQQSLALDLTADREALCRYFWSEQNGNGSWSIAPDLPGDLSTTVEAYLALKILGTPADDARMRRARDFTLTMGGVAKVRVFTRIYLATFGLFPWAAVPQLPVELILVPSWCPINIYTLSSWARSTIVPLVLVGHHQPIYALPNCRSAQNDFLDELWCAPQEKMVPYAPSLWEIYQTDVVSFLFTAIDKFLVCLGGLRSWPCRSYARRQCLAWILDHQEISGDWAGIFPPMHLGLLALSLEGFQLTDDPMVRGLEAVERFAWQDKKGKRFQSCVSPVWDTVLMTRALCDAQVLPSDQHLVRAVQWVKDRQLLSPDGDWRVYRPRVTPGGWSFEYFNNWYPDIDDTAAVILALIKQDPSSARSTCVIQAAEWVLGMQNPDGGWAAFDVENDKLFLNKIPFSDMDSLCDPSTADVSARVLEAFGLLLTTGNNQKRFDKTDFLHRVRCASHQVITYLASTQEETGAWYGRWGSNYVYGTSNALCGLAYFTKSDPRVEDMLHRGAKWLKSVQRTDGGWGEELDSYKDPSRAGLGPTTTPSQTAWALMGLLSYLPPADETIKRGIVWLVMNQTDVEETDLEAASWPETYYTGTGFPNFFYIGYTLYRHYFPMMALGRYVRAVQRMDGDPVVVHA